MATQVLTYTEVAEEMPQGGPSGIQIRTQDNSSAELSTIDRLWNEIAGRESSVLDRFISPEHRAASLARLEDFVLANPKLSIFLGLNIALTCIPLGIFVLYTTSVTVCSLVVGLLLGLLGAVFFIIFWVGIALCILLPTVFFATLAASFIFLWSIAGYYILQWARGPGVKPPGDRPGYNGDHLNAAADSQRNGVVSATGAEGSNQGVNGFSKKYVNITLPARTSGMNGSATSNGDVDSAANTITSQDSTFEIIPKKSFPTDGIVPKIESGSNGEIM